MILVKPYCYKYELINNDLHETINISLLQIHFSFGMIQNQSIPWFICEFGDFIIIFAKEVM